MVTPTYSFSGDPATSDKDAVRFWIQDMGPDVWLVSDQGILFVLQQYTQPLFAAAQVLRALASQYAQKVTKRVGDLSINYSDKAKQFLALADDLEQQASMNGVMPYGGGVSKSDMRAVAENSDRPKPAFRVKQFDNPSGLNNTTEFDPNPVPLP